MKIEKFVKEVEAVYFDGVTDVQEIAQWCGGMIGELVDPNGMIRTDMYTIDVVGPGGYMVAGAGFYIFKDGVSFFAMPAHDFLHNFKGNE